RCSPPPPAARGRWCGPARRSTRWRTRTGGGSSPRIARWWWILASWCSGGRFGRRRPKRAPLHVCLDPRLLRVAEVHLLPRNALRLARQGPADQARGADAEARQQRGGAEVERVDVALLAAPGGADLHDAAEHLAV